MEKLDKTELKWRELALQFDGHRMQALWFLKQILKELPEEQFKDARDFLSEGPLSGEEVLRNRIGEMADAKLNHIRAEAFRTLEQRAEAAEAQLADLAKQKPYGYINPKADNTVQEFGWAGFVTPVFTRPAPAADLAELVPDEVDNWKNPASEAMRDIGYVGSKQDFTVGANWMRAAILRKIEEAK